MSLLVTFVLLNGPDNASLECLAKSLIDLMSKKQPSLGAPGESGTYCTCMERSHGMFILPQNYVMSINT